MQDSSQHDAVLSTNNIRAVSSIQSINRRTAVNSIQTCPIIAGKVSPESNLVPSLCSMTGNYFLSISGMTGVPSHRSLSIQHRGRLTSYPQLCHNQQAGQEVSQPGPLGCHGLVLQVLHLSIHHHILILIHHLLILIHRLYWILSRFFCSHSCTF